MHLLEKYLLRTLALQMNFTRSVIIKMNNKYLIKYTF